MAFRLFIKMLVLTFSCVSINAQDVVRTVDTETYEQVLDIALPMTLNDSPFDYGYLIRVRPSAEAEYLLKIVANERKIEMTKYETLNGHLFSYLSKVIEEKVIDDPKELAKNVKLKKEMKVFSEEKFKGLRKQFARKLSLALDRDELTSKGKNTNGSAVVIIHGTVYEIKYISSQRENISFWVYDYPIDAKTHDSQLIPWIRNVLRLFIEH